MASDDLDRVNQIVMEQLTGGSTSYGDTKKAADVWWEKKEDERKYEPSRSGVTASLLPRTSSSSSDYRSRYDYGYKSTPMGNVNSFLKDAAQKAKNITMEDTRREKRGGMFDVGIDGTAAAAPSAPTWLPTVLLIVAVVVLKVLAIILYSILNKKGLGIFLEV